VRKSAEHVLLACSKKGALQLIHEIHVFPVEKLYLVLKMLLSPLLLEFVFGHSTFVGHVVRSSRLVCSAPTFSSCSAINNTMSHCLKISAKSGEFDYLVLREKLFLFPIQVFLRFF
jgi:hypothetical protein